MIRTTILALTLLVSAPLSAAESLFIMAWDGAGLVNINRLLGESQLPNSGCRSYEKVAEWNEPATRSKHCFDVSPGA